MTQVRLKWDTGILYNNDHYFSFLLDYLRAQMIAFETDIHAVAGLLKRYFRELPDPLFTGELYISFVHALGNINRTAINRRLY